MRAQSSDSLFKELKAPLLDYANVIDSDENWDIASVVDQ